MNVLGVIPARYGSSRFPGKSLALIQGKPMIQYVYENASKCKSLTNLIVATDDIRIFEAVKSFGGEVMMTSKNHTNGSERCNEVLTKAGFNPHIIINIQGDQPFIQASHIQKVIDCFEEYPEAEITTLVKEITEIEELENNNIVKANIYDSSRIKYFSRKSFHCSKSSICYKHIGIYGFKPMTLQKLVVLRVTSNEINEKLEQLRWLDNEYSIYYKTTDLDSIAIDIPKDLEIFH